jgi:hypothetical protein
MDGLDGISKKIKDKSIKTKGKSRKGKVKNIFKKPLFA